MELYLIRHTNVAIKKGICYGLTDVDVAESFSQEVKSIKNKIPTISFDEIWSSPAKRCTKLTSSLFPKNTINTDNSLLELNFGDWEGKTWNEIFELPDGKTWMNNFVDFPCPNGESFQNQINRVEQLYLQNQKAWLNKRIAIVTHAGVIRSFQCILQGINPSEVFNQEIAFGELIKIKVTV